MDRRAFRALLALAVGAGLVLTTGGSVAARSDPAQASVMDWGWVTNRKPSASGTPYAYNRGNSSGGINTVNHNGTGDWTVSMPGIGNHPGGGVAFVTPMGRTNRICQNHSQNNFGGTISLRVLCYDAAGTKADTKFSLTYLHAVSGTADVAHFYADHPGPASYDAQAFYSYNAAGQPNHVTVVGTGHWTIAFKGLGTGQGNIQVSPLTGLIGAPAAYCQVGQWSNVGGDVQGDVYCFDVNGAPFNTKFYAAFIHDVGLKGDGGTRVAYAFAKESSNVNGYHPPAGRDYTTGTGPTTIYRYSAGDYKVVANGLAKGGAVALTAFGHNGHRCEIQLIKTVSPYQSFRVKCVNSGGTLADTKFLLAYEK